MLKFIKLCFTVVFIFSVSDALAQKWESITGDDPEPKRSSQSERSSPQKKLNITGGDTANMLANAAKKYEKAVGLMVEVTESGPRGYCTAWAIKQSIFATNAHCLEGKKDIQSQNIFIILNRNPSKKYRVISAKMHPLYKKTQKNFDGKESWEFSFDVGLATIEGRVDVVMPIAPTGELQKIGSGYPVAYLGFPSRYGSNYNVRDPIATMQTGIIVAMTDYWQGDSGFSKNFLLKHNMANPYGSSGSPIFNRKGQVIGVNNAGSREAVVIGRDPKTGQQIRRAIDSAAMINFGIRIDSINALVR